MNAPSFPHLSVGACDVGQGLFAAEPIAAGVPILRFEGPLLTLLEVRSKGASAANALQIGINRYLDLEEPGRFVNHSCAPNAVVKDDTLLVAWRDIDAGEEIRFDYSTTISDGWTMPCRCGSPACRGLVTAFQLLSVELQRRYTLLNCVQRFILDALEA